jgi:hypothetical protein
MQTDLSTQNTDLCTNRNLTTRLETANSKLCCAAMNAHAAELRRQHVLALQQRVAAGSSDAGNRATRE